MYSDPIRCLQQANAFLTGLIHTDSRPYANRPAQRTIRRLLARIGDPHQALQIIHIAGSKGKGSTALLAEVVLLHSGQRVGTFTSPHLQDWKERFRIDGQIVNDERFVAVLERLRPQVLALQADYPEDPVGFFDVATAVALLLFHEAAVDCAIMEVGLGGRLDATNIVQPRVTCITQIELEHTEQLGHTLAAIAREKAGIIKANVPVVTGRLPTPAAQVIANRAQAANAALIRLGREIRLRTHVRDELITDLRITYGALRIHATLPTPARHLAESAALAVACVQQLGMPDTDLTHAASEGFAYASLPGRCELLSRRPWIVLDVAHTRQSARALATVLERIPALCKHLLLSLSQGKNWLAIARSLVQNFATVTVTQVDPQRSWSPESLAEALRQSFPNLSVQVTPDPRVAVNTICTTLAADELLCVAGSVYLVGAVRPLLRQWVAANESGL